MTNGDAVEACNTSVIAVNRFISYTDEAKFLSTLIKKARINLSKYIFPLLRRNMKSLKIK